MNSHYYPDLSVSASNQPLPRPNTGNIFPFSTQETSSTESIQLNNLRSSHQSCPVKTQSVKILKNKALIIETQAKINICRFYSTKTKESVKIGELLYENLNLKVNNTELLNTVGKLKQEVLKLNEELSEIRNITEKCEQKLKIYEKNNLELSISLSNHKVRAMKKSELEYSKRISILLDENQKINRLNEKMREIIQENVSPETLRLQEENRVLKDCYNSLDEYCKSIIPSKTTNQTIEKDHFTNELHTHLKSLESENLSLKQQLSNFLNSE